MDTPYFPLFINLSGKKILVAGGGKIALRRVRTLMRFGADIRIVSPVLCAELEELCSASDTSGRKDREENASGLNGALYISRRKYESGDAVGAALVIAATNDRETNRRICRECREIGIPVNTVDERGECDFYFPSVVMTDSIVVGINSGGEDPGRTKKIRRKIEDLLAVDEKDRWYDEK